MEPAQVEAQDPPYELRAIFVRVKSKTGSTPAELSQHPELRFRVLPREPSAAAAPLVVNGASIPADEEMVLTLRRDRAGCYVSMDELRIHDTVAFEILCEKERWAHGKLAPVASGESCWTLELAQVTSVHCLGMLNDSARLPAERTLDLELCMVGTCSGRPECLTRETSLQVWKVVSPRSFVSQPSMSAIREECDMDVEEDEAVGALERCHMSDGFGPLGEGSSSRNKLGMDMCEVGAGGAEGSGALMPWKGEASLFDRGEILKNVRRKYENLMTEYHDGNDDVMKGEMTWFSAGIRIGVGMGLGVCLGLGLGVGILVNGYKVSRERLASIQNTASTKVLGMR